MLIQHKKRTNNPTEKWAEDLDLPISKADRQMANKAHEKMLNITKYQRNGNQNYSEAPVRMAIIKKFTNNKCWRRCGENGTLIHC